MRRGRASTTAAGPSGLETGQGGSINVETIEFLGAHNVAGERQGGMATVSLGAGAGMESGHHHHHRAGLCRERANRRRLGADQGGAGRAEFYLSPGLPFGWVDFPPSVNRLVGLWWLAKVLYPDQFADDLRPITREFFQRFYHMTPSDAQIDAVLGAMLDTFRA